MFLNEIFTKNQICSTSSSMSQNGVRGGLVFLKRGQPGGYDIHHWKRLVLYFMGKIAIKSEQQQHRGHERSFSVSTNPILVFGHMTGFWCDCKLVTKISQGFQIRFFCCKLVYPLSRLRPGAVSSPPSMLPPLTSFCSPFCLSVAFQVGYSYCKKQSSWSTPWCLSSVCSNPPPQCLSPLETQYWNPILNRILNPNIETQYWNPILNPNIKTNI